MSAIVVFLFYPTDIIDDNFLKVLCHPTFYVLLPLLEGFHETVEVAVVVGVAAVAVDFEVVFVAVAAVGPEVSELVFVAVDIPDVFEPQAFVDIVVVFVVAIIVAVVLFVFGMISGRRKV